ncbi:MAG TPA: putative 2OG-Fe(II) oxygenase [Phenylobacterium sp.]|nr:putative 2OG-Fe(II) oxygenase [Phenylobacterium sp.]
MTTPLASDLDRAMALLAQDKPEAAAKLSARAAEAAGAPHRALAAHSQILKVLHRHEEALAFDRQAVDRFPRSAVAWHNLAATLGDMGRGAESRAAVERGMSIGLDGPQSWGVYARALMSVGEHDLAEKAYVEARRRAPADVRLASEYANYVWMRRGDLSLGLASMDTAFHAGAPPGEPLLTKAKLLEAAGMADKACELLLAAAAAMPQDVPLLLAACQAAIEQGLLADAERLARSAEVLAPRRPGVLNQLAIVYLATGRPNVALDKARRGLEISPGDQSLLGWAATAARLTGDPLYKVLNDYDRLVATYDIETPQGWPSLEAYLADLSATLHRLHVYERHPSNQSLRGGAQTMQNLSGSDEPALRAFFAAIDGPIRRHMEHLGPGDDPHRRRNTGDYKIEGAWSVLLRPGGFHKDHFHSQGWLSSAFYVETPETALDREDREGWLRFGQPPIRTQPPVTADHYVRPKPGRLALFPSYMWHGTVPFTTDEGRLTVAFDLVPA